MIYGMYIRSMEKKKKKKFEYKKEKLTLFELLDRLPLPLIINCVRLEVRFRSHRRSKIDRSLYFIDVFFIVNVGIREII